MLVVMPHHQWALGGTVTGTVDTDYTANWLVDGRSAFPVRSASLGLSLAVSAAAGSVGLAAVVNHNLIVPAVLTGGVSATITPPATRPPHDIQESHYVLVSPVATGVTGVTFTVAGNDIAPMVGGLVMGAVTTLDPVKVPGAEFGIEDFRLPRAGEFRSIPLYDRGVEGVVHRGQQYYSTADLALIKAWFRSQRSGSRPSLVVLNEAENVCLYADFTSYRVQAAGTYDMGLWLVTFEFVEEPRWRFAVA